MTAYAGSNPRRPDRESPPSNTAYWSSQPCPRIVRVTFDSFSTFHLGDDEWWAEGSVGPIYGNFWACGSTEGSLSFSAVDYGDWWGERDRGYRLRSARYYRIQEIFDWVHREMASCLGSGCPVYSAPHTNSVTVELGPYDTLTFGGRIWDVDSDNPDDTLFDGQLEMRASEIAPGRHRIWDRNIELAVLIDVLVGPEAGGHPDLTIIDVTVDEASGQVRTRVFNNAADLPPSDIAVDFQRYGTDEVIASITWEDVAIPTGGSRVLQTGEPIAETGGLLVVVDPENAITEMNDDNNTYETPIQMRVQFVRARAGSCNENCCSIFDCDSEHVFFVWAGHGPAAGDVTWIGYNVRFPRSGELIACTHPICAYRASPDEDWNMEGNEQYTFEFEMPPSESLYVMVTGREKDVLNNPDSLGQVFHEYDSSGGWGASPDVHVASYGRETLCDDTFCCPCRNDGLTARWRITRLR